MSLNLHRGNIVRIRENTLQFYWFITVADPSSLVPKGSKVWYEVTFEGGNGWSVFGWATKDFKRSNDGTYGVGMCAHSYGLAAQRQYAYHNNDTFMFGTEVPTTSKHVVGVAADMENGRLLYGLDGNWTHPWGVAFSDINTDKGLFPALSGCEITFSVNFGEEKFVFSPPDNTFKPFKDVLKVE